MYIFVYIYIWLYMYVYMHISTLFDKVWLRPDVPDFLEFHFRAVCIKFETTCKHKHKYSTKISRISEVPIADLNVPGCKHTSFMFMP